jgi:hypothetical protein
MDLPRVSRRTALKTGAMTGVAVAWAAPVVQTLGQQGAGAAVSSPCQTVATVAVPVDGTTVSVNGLEVGTTYTLAASGTFVIGQDPEWADAQYAFFEDDSVYAAYCGGTPSGTNLGILLNQGPFNGVGIGPSGEPITWGAYNPVHTYTQQYTATGSTLTLVYSDCNYSDNVATTQYPGTGPLTVSVLLCVS